MEVEDIEQTDFGTCMVNYDEEDTCPVTIPDSQLESAEVTVNGTANEIFEEGNEKGR